MDRPEMPSWFLPVCHLLAYYILKVVVGGICEVNAHHFSFVHLELFHTSCVSIILPASERIFLLFIRS